MPFSSLINGTFNSGSAFDFRIKTNGGRNRFGFDGDDFYIRGQGVQGKQRFDNLDDFFGLAVTVFGGSVVQDAQFLDADIAAGKLPTDLRVEDGSLALIEGAGITGSFKARFDSNAHAQNFLAFVEQMTSLIDANDAIAADPSEFRFAVGEIEVFYDASAQDFGFKNDTGAQQRFDALEPFVEALARDLGGTQTRDGTFNEERIADGRGPSIRVQKDTDLLIAGRSVSGRFKFEFDTAEQAETARQVFTQLFADIAETGAIGGEGLPGAEDTSTGIDADAAEGLIAITPDAGPASQAIFAAPSASPASIPATTAAPTELSQVEAGQGGFVINGASAGDQSGYSVSNAGDVNGDGLDDLVIGANAADPNGGNSGASYVVFGKTDSAAIELSAIAAGSGGFVINGVSANDRAGGSVSGAGDINGDGLQDLIVGASFDGPNGSFSGASFVVFGKTDGASVELSNVETGAGGFAVNGANASDFAGRAVSIAGDVNGDGLDDLIIGASGDDPNGQSSGASFVVFGRTDSSALELSDIELGNGGFVINGASAGDQSGRAVSSAGDVNGDGLDDLVIGAPVDDPNGSASGASFVVFGKTDGVLVEVSDIDAGVGGFAINGVSAGDQSGRSVSTAGDVNGDGLEDLIIGASSADPNAANAGASYVVFGKTDAGAVELSDVEAGAGGFVINGISATDFSGFSVSTAGDINGDGLTDLIIGANLADPNGDSSGASYVVFGKTDTSATELSDVENGSGGFILKGVSAGDRAGNSVSGAGDINGDGFDDIIVGAPFDDPNGSSSGASFVVFGGNFSGAATQIGTTGVDTLTGTNASDTLIAGTDNDILIGNGGSDVLRAGEGDDVVAISDLSFNVVDGGNGVDTLRLDGSGLTLDLAAVADTRLSQIEAIDLAGNGNTLVVDRLEVLRLSGETNTLRVFGQGVDTFEFATGTAGDWQQLASIIDDGITFDVFVNGRARVEIQQGIGDLPDASDDTARTDEDTAVTINVLDNDAGSGLVITAIDGTPISTGETVTLASGANVTLNVDGTVDYGPNDQFEGLSSGDSTTDSFSYTVEGGGQTRQADVTVTIDGVEDAPVVTADTARTDEDTAVSIDVLDNDVDPDSTLVIAALNGTNVVAGQTVTLASGAIVTLNQDGTLDYDPNGQFEDLSGGDSTTDSFSYTIDADGETRQATVTVTIDGVEDAPVANPDTARTDEDTAVTIDVLANDTDPDSDLVITQVDGTPISAGQTVTLASGALVTLNIDGTVDYDPNGQFEGFGSGDSTTDSFIYTIDADGETVQATATITIDGVDDLPSATDDTARTDEDTAVTIDVLNNDSDPDGDLVITAIAGTPIAAGQTVTLASGALVTLNVDGTVDYDPNDQFEDLSGGGDSTTDSFSYTVEGGGQTRQASVTVTIDGVEDAPVVAADTVRTDEDTAVTVDVLNNDNDPDSTLTITALDGTTVVAGDSVTLASGAIVTLNQNGTVDYDPNDQFEDLSGGDSTTDSFTYTIDADGETQQATVTVTIDGIEDAPIANDDTALTDKDTAISVAVLANDIDPDSTLTVSSLEGASVQVGETITLASGALITLNQNGTVEYNPNGQFDSLAAGASATDSFTYAIDGDGEVDQATVTVTISGVGAGSPVTELSTIEAGTGGFVINGVSENDVSGVSVSNAGDVNGDGLDDIIVGARGASPNANGSGASFVVFGKTDSVVVELSDIEAGNGGFVIKGTGFGSGAGGSVSGAGDVNGDGLQDLLVGARGSSPNAPLSGASFVVFGKSSGSPVELSDVRAGVGGFAIDGIGQNDQSGGSVSTGGDVNGDGLDDLIIGARQDNPNGPDSGASFVVFGKTDGGTVELLDVENGSGGFIIAGVSANDRSGTSVSLAGDVNGDGLDDVIVGAPYDDPNGEASGASFLVFGKTDSTLIELSDIENGSGGFVIRGISEDDASGISVSSAGDVNGDGLEDLIIGANGDDPNGDRSGASFVVFGKTDGSAIDLSAVESGTGGFVINGVSEADRSGHFVSSAGDVNGDGLDDLIIGADRDDPNGDRSGASFVVFGKTGGASVELSDVELSLGGFVVNGVSEGDAAGYSVSGGGDINGDGFDDIIIGAYRDDPNGDNSGATFVVFGGDFSGAATQIGTVGVDTLTGTAAADNLIAGTDNDLLIGNGGEDVLRGGEGDDTLAVSDLNFKVIDGGNGIDTLRLDGNGLNLDLTTIADTRISEIERIDLAGNGNTLTIDRLETLRLSSETNTVRVFGDSSDSVEILAGSDPRWQRFDSITDGSITFDVFVNGRARLEIQQGVNLIDVPVAVELSDIEAGTGGFVINGVSEFDGSGSAVSNAGDVNGDGLDDLIVGALFDDPNGEDSGASFVVFGKTDGGVVELSDVDAGSGGFAINGAGFNDQSGTAVSGGGDINGDGLKDLVIGAPTDNPNGAFSGSSYVVFGRTGTAPVELSDIEAGSGGFAITGVSATDASGQSLSIAGDVNGDGLDDLIVGALGDDPNGSYSGASFVVFGKTDGTAIELSAVENGVGGFVINGVSEDDSSGEAVSNAGDINGDGLDDLIVGAFRDDPNGSGSGAAFVVYGKTDSSVIELSDIENGVGGFAINGVSAGDGAGAGVSAAGDVNGDGLADLFVGAPNEAPNGLESGAGFVVFGTTGGVNIELSSVEAGSGGFAINGVSDFAFTGNIISDAGDVNGDGLSDLILGVPADGPNGSRSGASFVVFGKTDGTAVELSDVEIGAGGFVVNGVSSNDQSGRSVSGGGDVNGDGFDDLIIGASGDDPNGESSGATFVVFGGDFSGAATQIGTVGADTLTGTAAADNLIAGTDNDLLIGNGGEDVLRGGEGGDTLAVSDLNFKVIDGGNGVDTLRLDGNGLTLDLTTIADTRISEIERIDLAGNGNTLTIDRLETLRLSSETNTVRVFGDSSDSVEILAGSDPTWQRLDSITDGSITFDVFVNGRARLEIQDDVSIVPGSFIAVELSDVEAGIGGFVINGVSEVDISGSAVSNAGDVNGDGLDDLIVGADNDDPNGTSSGASFVVFGKTDSGVVELSDVEAGIGGFVINGAASNDRAGTSVSGAGDINGDGLKDLIVGAATVDTNGGNSGASFVVFGKTDGTAVELSAVENGVGGFAINGASQNDLAGSSISNAGDVNGDGLDDLIVGAVGDRPNGGFSGASFVVFGKTDSATIELSAVENGAGGFVINGVNAGDFSGRSVSGSGDINGDGLDDLIVSADGDDPNGSGSGASFVVFGKTSSAAIELADIEAGSGGFVINGTSENTFAGESVANAGDVNGDGLDDLIVGASGEGPNGSGSGASFVVFGKTGDAAVELSDIQAGVGGFVINGVSEGDFSGRSVSGAGDVNGDGLNDLIIGADGDDPNGSYSGASFVVFGKSDGAAVELSDVETGAGGFVINGVSATDLSGSSVSGGGDINGDGFDDLIVGAPFDSPNGYASGASFVVFGGDFSGAATQIGTVGVDTLTGTAAADNLIAGTDNDILIGNGGADVLRGGEGDDTLAISNLNFKVIDGGNGVDTLRVDGNGLNLDLTTIADTRISEIERIDLSGNGNTLTIDRLETLRLSSETNTVRVFGDSSDSVEILAGNDLSWQRVNTITDGSITFDVFVNGRARLEIQQGVSLIGAPVTVELSDVEAGIGGFAINGVSSGDYSSRSVSNAGDVNGDGLDDVIIGAYLDDPNGSQSGASFVVFGKTNNGTVELSDVEAGNGGFVINGISANDNAGISVSGSGDINGDGLADLIVGAEGDQPNGNQSGASFVVFGKSDSAQVNLSDVEAGNGGFVINGASQFDRSGGSVSTGGDVNGDGLSDIIVGANGVDTNGSGAGASYVVFGKTDGAAINVSGLASTNSGLVINGVSQGDEAGGSVSNAGDVNGDGLDDLIIGAQFDDPNGQGSGASFVVFGRTSSSTIELSAVENGVGGFVINGVSGSDFSGRAVSGAGDVNGDGFEDLIVGAAPAGPNGAYSGASYVVFGKTDGTSVELSDVNAGTGGFAINGVSVDDYAGVSVSSAGDVNGDGLEDLIVGASLDDPNDDDSGAAFVVFGKTDTSTVELSDVELGVGGFVLNGVSQGDLAGTSVSGGGDVNGDGFDDLIIGAFYDDPNGDNSGASFVVLGGDFTGAATQIGTGGVDTLTGTGEADNLIAGTDNDLLIGNGGTDVLRGGEGDDTLATSDLNFKVIDGGNGVDTLRLDGSGQTLDLTAIADTRISEIERIDLSGNGNALVVDQLEVLRLSGTTNTLRVFGQGADTVEFAPGAALGWQQVSSIMDGGLTFDVFVNGLARLEVQQGIVQLPPIAVADDIVRTDEDTAVTVDVLANDLDIVGNFVITAIDGTTVAPGETVTLASGAVVTLNQDGTVDYDPNDQFESLSGGEITSDTFTYTIDADGETRQATVTVTIDGVEDSPVVAADSARTDEDTAVRVDVLGNDIDPDSTITITALDGTNVTAGQTVTLASGAIVTLNQNGTVDYDPNGQFESLSGGDTATDSFTYTIDADGETREATVTVTIDGVEDAPIATDDTAQTDPNTPISIAVLANDIDPDSTLTITDFNSTLVQVGETVTLASGALVTLNPDGTVDYDPNGQFDGLIAGASVIDSFTYIIDGDGQTDEATVTVTIDGAGTDTAVTELSDIEAGIGGFVINGVSESDLSGFSVSNAGDVNGDGLDDLIVGAGSDSPNGLASGASFVVFGKTDSGAVELSDVEAGTGGFVIKGVSELDRAGGSVSGGGDVNGDGLADLIVGADRDDPNGESSGASFVVFGKSDGTAVELSNVEAGSGGFVINGVSEGDSAGDAVSIAGDVNGDGLDDLIVGAPTDQPNGFNSGASFVIFGKTDGGAIELSNVEASAGGFVINGVSSDDEAGTSVSDAGDVNGDGLDDLIVGAPYDDPNGNLSGASFVVFGKTGGGVVELSDVEAGSGGFVINGVDVADLAGRSVSGAGDVNGDGREDLIIGAVDVAGEGFTGTDTPAGAGYVVFGKSSGGAVELSDIEAGTGGFAINGVSDLDLVGRSVSGAGDVNGDGLDDVIIGAPGDDPNGNYSGASFVVFGRTGGASVELSDVEQGLGGFVLNGVSEGDSAGVSVSAAGDVNGDGFDDLIVGADGDDPNGESSGASFVVFGGDFTGAATQIGTTGNDTLLGAGADDVLIGGTGDDLLGGGSGADVLRGGAGDDTLSVQGLDFKVVDGGNGFDRLDIVVFDQTVDLRNIADTRISSIERIDMNGATSTLVLDRQEVLRISNETNTLRVTTEIAGSNNSVELIVTDGDPWLKVDTIQDNGDQFDVFISGRARLEVQQTLSLTGVQVATIELADIEADDNTAGFVINGVSEDDYSGYSVSNAGDVNGDGFDDVIVGAYLDDPNDPGAGASFVVFGKTDGSGIELSDVEAGSGGFVINGINGFDESGGSVSSAGDVNGDGLADLLVGASRRDVNGNDSGASYVVFGKTGSQAIELSDIDTGLGGFAINGVTSGDQSGRSVSSAGDVNGDGLADLLVGAGYSDANGNNSGASYVIFGKTGGSTVELSDVEDGIGGFSIAGAAQGDRAGISVSDAGDVNGDGLDDLIIGAPEADPNAPRSSGASFVVFGKSDTTPLRLNDVASGSGGFVINGVSIDDRSGISVSGAGDVNGDGLEDLVVGAYFAAPDGVRSGASYVVFGKTDSAAIELTDIEAGTGGFVINGVSFGDQAGRSVSVAGDINGDGLDDLLVGAPQDDPNSANSGAGFVVFGKSDGDFVELSDVELGIGGFVLNGVSGDDRAGRSVSAAGDVNGDGFDDLIIGAYQDDPNGPESGASFVVFGGDFSSAATQVGTVGDDMLIGTASRDVIIGGTGNDEIDGRGGLDVLRGGAGDDVIEIPSFDFARIDGGNGFDQLKLELGASTVDLTTIADTRITGIENIDISSSGATLTLDRLEVLRISDETNTLRITTSLINNTVELLPSDGNTWLQLDPIRIGGIFGETFDVYVSGNARLEVQQNITVEGVVPPPTELADIEDDNNAAGFVINGVSADDRSGISVSTAGDVNGDGFDDVIIGAHFDDPNGNQSGASFVVFGKTDGSGIELSDVEAGTGGFVLNGVSATDRAGFSVSDAGDVNGDGLADLIVGALEDNPNGNNSGASFVVFGKTDTQVVELSDIETGLGGFVINGVGNGDQSGRAVSSAGDVNGDGLADLLVGAFQDNPNGPDSGASFVVFGKTGGDVVELSDVERGDGGFVVNGASSNDQSGFSVSGAGDINGDGFDDLIIGARYDDPNGDRSGAGFIVFGASASQTVELDTVGIDGAGFAINGIALLDATGWSVGGGGDINGDGLEDVIISAVRRDVNATSSGTSFVVFGTTGTATVDLSDVEIGQGGFAINGISTSDFSGISVDTAGDINGDGLDDLIVGAYFDDPNGDRSGASFVVFGKSGGGVVELSDVEQGIGGFVLNGVSEGDRSGRSVSAAGDVNGDGFDDVIIGAPFDDPNGDDSGASFVVFGGDFSGAATQVGTVGDDMLIGTANRDVIIGGTGDDEIDGAAGADILRGGEGDDVFTVSALDFERIDGGNGFDQLQLELGAATVDLTTIADTRITGIENIDLLNSSATLTLDRLEVIRISDETNTLRITTSLINNTVELLPSEGNVWLQRDSVQIGGIFGDTFDVYVSGNARLEVQQNIAVSGALLATTELADIAQDSNAEGFVINGVSGDDRSGFSVSTAGDVNGDGFDDVIIGAPGDDPNNNNSGAGFVVFGKTDGSGIELSDVEAGTSGFVINGVSMGNEAGFSASDAGDVNGDGLADVIIGALRDDPNGSNSGASFVVFGKTDMQAVDLSDIETGLGGFVINGVSIGDQSGQSVSAAGDVNGDGLADLLIGAPYSDPNGSTSGESYVVFGKTGGSAIELSDVEGGQGGFVIAGVSEFDRSGIAVSDAGDVNGDGFDDIIVGASNADPNGAQSGASYVVFGKSGTATVALSDIETGSGGFVINGASENDSVGISVSGAGDINGDGLEDLIVGAQGVATNGVLSGASYVVFGKTGNAAVELSDIEAGIGGFVINGVSTDDRAGRSVSVAGDLNGDGLDDLIVGAPGDDPNGYSSGASFVVFGKSGGAAVELSDVETGFGGFVLNGVSAGDQAGRSVSAAGDVNGDGFDDLIIGAYGDDPNGSSSGASFIVFGNDFTGAATRVGTAGDDTLAGSNADDVLIGGTGNDLLNGNAGPDVLRGGAGDDAFNVNGLDFKVIDGGNGFDRLNLVFSSSTIDLRNIADTRIGGIERINLSGVNATLVLDRQEVLRTSDETNTLRVTTTLFNNSVELAGTDGPDWFKLGTIQDDGVDFVVYTSGLARLEVRTNIAVTGVPTFTNELSEIAADSNANGFVINGVTQDDEAGRAVSNAGDVNGDGFDDLIIGAPLDDPNGAFSGASFVVFGKTDGASIELSDVEAGSGGFVINGATEADLSGFSVSAAGDVNGDGLDDVIVGAFYADPNGSGSGAGYVVFGKTDNAAVELGTLQATGDGFAINGQGEGDEAGTSVHGAGDVNGDGLDDIIIGAPTDTPNGSGSGASFVVFGKTDSTAVELIAVENGTGGFAINGAMFDDRSGYSVSGGGDINGDGFDDLVVGAYRADPNAYASGASFVVFGKTDGSEVELRAVGNGNGGFAINGVGTGDNAGQSVSVAGDVNGDGLEDIIVGAPDDRPNGVESGASFVVFGKTDTSEIELSDVEFGAGGFAINGVSRDDSSGASVSGAGDINGDGLDDIIVGARYDDPNGANSGASFVVFGKTDGSTVELSDIEAGVGGFVLKGAAQGDRSGESVSGAGDVNGDGFDDLLIGAPDADPNGTNSGANFVVFGGDFTGAATQVGTSGADTLTATSEADNLFGGAAADILESLGAGDFASGGQGADTFVFSDAALSGQATIRDFDGQAGDVLDISDFGFTQNEFNFIFTNAVSNNLGEDDTLLDLGNGQSIVLEDFNVTDFQSNDFII